MDLTIKDEVLNYIDSNDMLSLDYVLHIIKFIDLDDGILINIFSKTSKEYFIQIIKELNYLSFNVFEYCITKLNANELVKFIEKIKNPTRDMIYVTLSILIKYANGDNIVQMLLLYQYEFINMLNKEEVNEYSFLIEKGFKKLTSKEQLNVILKYDYNLRLVLYFLNNSSYSYIDTLLRSNINFFYAKIDILIDGLLNKNNYMLIRVIQMFYDLGENLLNYGLLDDKIERIMQSIESIYFPYLVVMYRRCTNQIVEIGIELYFKFQYAIQMETELLYELLEKYNNPSEELIKVSLTYSEYDAYYRLISFLKQPSDEIIDYAIKKTLTNVYELFMLSTSPSLSLIEFALDSVDDIEKLKAMIYKYNISQDIIIYSFYVSELNFHNLFCTINSPTLSMLEIVINKSDSNINIGKYFRYFKERNQVDIKAYNKLIEKYIFKFDNINDILIEYIGEFPKLK